MDVLEQKPCLMYTILDASQTLTRAVCVQPFQSLKARTHINCRLALSAIMQVSQKSIAVTSIVPYNRSVCNVADWGSQQISENAFVKENIPAWGAQEQSYAFGDGNRPAWDAQGVADADVASDLLKLGSPLLSASDCLLADAADLPGAPQQAVQYATLCLHLSCPENIVALTEKAASFT